VSFWRRGLALAGVLVVIVVAFGAGVYVDQNYPEAVPLLRLAAPQKGRLDRASTDQALRVIAAHYYDPHVDYGKLSGGSINGMVQALGDPYSSYLTADQFRRQQDSYAGHHSGIIGITVDFVDGYPVVASMLPNSPALQAGLQTEDVILRIDSTDAHNLTADQTSALIRGAPGSRVTLHVRRADGEHDVTVTRGDFRSPMVESLRLDSGVLYMRVYQFGDTTEHDFDTQLSAGLSGARGVVLDLRDNGGGFVASATAVISRFVDSGEAFEERERDGGVQRTNVDGNHPAASVPLVVLVNGNSASAAEIVAGALQARGRARLVGAKTFGKGSVQVDYQLADGSDLHLTVGHWFLPNGHSIEKQGLTPDLPVALPSREGMFDVVQPGRGHPADAQLNRALELLAGQ
jgi:carboxyl-terminal processing protease